MEVGILGPLEVRSDESIVDIRAGLPRVILAMLVLRRGRIVRSSELIEALWGDRPPQNPANALQTQIAYLRRRFGGHSSVPLIVTRPGGYSLDIASEAVDANRFEQVVEAISARSERGGQAALRVLDEAMALWRGAALADVADHDFALGEAMRLEELRLVAMELRNELMLDLGRHQELTAALRRQVGEHPLRERLHCQLMVALYRSGRQAEALRAYSNARAVLVDELGIEPGVELRELERRILDQDPDLDRLPVDPGDRIDATPKRMNPVEISEQASGGRSRLPSPISALVGRDAEIERVNELLTRSRLVTLTGPGGAGKTRLAIAVGERHRRTGDVWFVDLAQVSEPDAAPHVVAHALGLAVSPSEDPTAAVATALSRCAGLLILDTCEHVVDAVARLVAAVLREGGGVRCVATSRRPLNVSGEIAWPVPPLDLPTDDLIGLDAVRSCASVALFAERAAAVNPQFEVTRENVADVAQICLALDGLPLAIELAAARIDVLSPRAIRERLRRRFDLLVDGDRSAGRRQQSLRGTVEWSAGLLGDDERTFFARMGVFEGGFDLDAATAVGGESEHRTLELLTSLVRHSMIEVVGPERYRLLDTLRAFALEELAALDADAVRDRHAEYYLGCCQLADRGVRSADQPMWLTALRADRANHRAAFEWFLTGGNGAAAARLVTALRWFYTFDGMFADGERQLQRVLELDALEARDRAGVLGGLALITSSLRQIERAESLALECVEAAREADDPAEIVFGLNFVALTRAALGNHAASGQALDEALALGEVSGDAWCRALSHVLVARNALDQAQEDAAVLARRAMEAADACGDGHLRVVALRHLVNVSLHEGDPDTAERHAIRALDQAEQIGSSEATLGALHALGLALEANGKLDLAERTHVRALQMALRAGHLAAACQALEALGVVATVLGQTERARRLIDVAEAKRATLGLVRRRTEHARVVAARSVASGDASNDWFDSFDSLDSFDSVVSEILEDFDAWTDAVTPRPAPSQRIQASPTGSPGGSGTA